MKRNGWHKTAFGMRFFHYFNDSHMPLCSTGAMFFAITEKDQPFYIPKGDICKKCKKQMIKRKLKEYKYLE